MSARHRPRTIATVALALAALAPAATAAATDRPDRDVPRLDGRAVLPAEALAAGPPSGAALVPAGQPSVVLNGITFPRPSQPVAGFSGIVEGRRPGEWLAMTDNGYGSRASSRDFNLRAYVVRPDFKTADGGSGGVDVRDFVEFSDPRGLFPYPIVNAGTKERVLTGADVDPESFQRAADGTFWIGDEFGPWILHFDAKGRLLERPYDLPDQLWSVNHPDLPNRAPARIANSRGIEAMAMTPNGRWLYVVLEGAVLADATNPADTAFTRRVYEFDTRKQRFTGRLRDYRVEPGADGTDSTLVADAQALDRWHLLVVERDGGRGLNATYRSVWEADLRGATPDGVLAKRLVLDLTAIPDPDLVSLPGVEPTDVGLGDPFRVTCESIEALRIVSRRQLLLGCDNNLPNEGRSPVPIADDTELITVRIPT